MRVRVTKPKPKEVLSSLILDLLPGTWELPTFLLHKSRYASNDFQGPNSEAKILNKIVPKPLKNRSVPVRELMFFSFFIWIRKWYKILDTPALFFQHSSKIHFVYNFSGIFKNLSNGRGPKLPFLTQLQFQWQTAGQKYI